MSNNNAGKGNTSNNLGRKQGNNAGNSSGANNTPRGNNAGKTAAGNTTANAPIGNNAGNAAANTPRGNNAGNAAAGNTTANAPRGNNAGNAAANAPRGNNAGNAAAANAQRGNNVGNAAAANAQRGNNAGNAAANAPRGNNAGNTAAGNAANNAPRGNNLGKVNNNSTRGNNNSNSGNNNATRGSNNSNNGTNNGSRGNNNGNNGNNNGSKGNNNGNNNKSSVTNKLTELKNNKTLMQVLKLLVIAIVTFLIMFGIRWFLKSQQNNKTQSPYIIRGSNSGKNSIVVSQNPAEDNSITLYRSDGEEGAEFTYTSWLLIQNLEYKSGEWKHVFHKGNKTSFPNRAPGVWIHPNNNALRIYMNTYENPLEYIDIGNIPVRKWFHIAISLNHKYLDIYFNGQLRKRKELNSLPRQNYGDLWCCLFGGFEGYISKLQYHRKALDYKQVESIVREGPSKDACGDTGEYPPYLDDSWWYDI